MTVLANARETVRVLLSGKTGCLYTYMEHDPRCWMCARAWAGDPGMLRKYALEMARRKAFNRAWFFRYRELFTDALMGALPGDEGGLKEGKDLWVIALEGGKRDA
ncbi:hypothetical protein SAMN05421505_11298 [Sinosporangium album]|uniref:Uncharacterized protein n=1 Tax=Sinosporangium album TaxID=504805 RepID=A0A1G8ADU4_9ACTN|nr:hypothetical protein [Sinosporangium album]SDH18510.1 hypothetical protein SAMN05421505_11298 [Sinosporangium album]